MGWYMCNVKKISIARGVTVYSRAHLKVYLAECIYLIVFANVFSVYADSQADRVYLPILVSPRLSAIDAMPSPTRFGANVVATPRPLHMPAPSDLVYAGCVVRAETYTAKKLSSISRTDYNKYSMPEEIFVDEDADGTFESRTVIHYRNNLQKSQLLSEDSGGKLTNQIVYFYDNNNNQTKIDYDFDGDGKFDNSAIMKYNKNNQMVVYSSLDEIRRYTYDDNGMINKKEIDTFADGIIDTITKYIWNNNMLEREMLIWGDGVNFETSAIYKYDNGNLIESDTVIGHMLYRYTQKNEISEMLLYKGVDLELKIVFVYDEFGRLKYKESNDILDWNEIIEFHNLCNR